MSCKWKECTLGDLITFQRGHDLPKNKMTDGKYPVVGSNGIIGYHNEYTTESPSITIGRSGNVGNPFIFYGRTWSHNTTLYVKDFKGNDPVFVFYFLKTLDLVNYSGGSAVPTLNRNHIHTLPIKVPESAEIQKKIGYYLRLLDEKIAINRAINENLERQAQALYENIFCIPSDIDTKHISLSDLMDYAGGSQPPASEFVFRERDGYIRFVQIRDYDTDSHITYIPDSPKNKLCEEHDIMIARYGASLGRICYGINGAYNVALAKVFPKKSFFREFLRCYLSSRTFYEGINNKGGRSAQAGFNQSDINSFEIDFPVDETIVKNFECTVAPMFERRLQVKKENQHLASLRDTLLPKLMSGELDVSKIKI